MNVDVGAVKPSLSTMRRWQMCIRELLTRARQRSEEEEEEEDDWNKALSRQRFDPEEKGNNMLELWLCETDGG